MKRLLASVFVLFVLIATQGSVVGTDRGDQLEQIPTGEVTVFLQEHEGKSTIAQLEKTSFDEHTPYKVGAESKEGGILKFNRVPYGEFSIWVAVENCGGPVYGKFSFQESVKKVKIFFNAKECRFTMFSFGVK